MNYLSLTLYLLGLVAISFLVHETMFEETSTIQKMLGGLMIVIWPLTCLFGLVLFTYEFVRYDVRLFDRKKVEQK